MNGGVVLILVVVFLLGVWVGNVTGDVRRAWWEIKRVWRERSRHRARRRARR